MFCSTQCVTGILSRVSIHPLKNWEQMNSSRLCRPSKELIALRPYSWVIAFWLARWSTKSAIIKDMEPKVCWSTALDFTLQELFKFVSTEIWFWVAWPTRLSIWTLMSCCIATCVAVLERGTNEAREMHVLSLWLFVIGDVSNFKLVQLC